MLTRTSDDDYTNSHTINVHRPPTFNTNNFCHLFGLFQGHLSHLDEKIQPMVTALLDTGIPKQRNHYHYRIFFSRSGRGRTLERSIGPLDCRKAALIAD